MTDHLTSAAAALERILHARYPEHSWIVTVRPEGDEGQGAAAPGVGAEHPGPMFDPQNREESTP
jgi:hypothetical protein